MNEKTKESNQSNGQGLPEESAEPAAEAGPGERADAPAPGEASANTKDSAAESGDGNERPEGKSENEHLHKRIAELEDSYMRAKAESENIKKRAQGEIRNAGLYASTSFAQSMLDVRDAIAAALANKSADKESLIEGIELTLKKVDSEFEKQMIRQINALEERFDPEQHFAMGTREHDSLEPNTVCEVLIPGFTIGDRILRAASVIITKAPETGNADVPDGDAKPADSE